jgi:hypothetical protein
MQRGYQRSPSTVNKPARSRRILDNPVFVSRRKYTGSRGLEDLRVLFGWIAMSCQKVHVMNIFIEPRGFSGVFDQGFMPWPFITWTYGMITVGWKATSQDRAASACH